MSTPSLPRYLVSIDVFKATAMVIVLGLHALSVSGLMTERNGALMGFEMMSGLFYELAGLGVARSVCRALSEGRTKRSVLGRLLWRALLLKRQRQTATTNGNGIGIGNGKRQRQRHRHR